MRPALAVYVLATLLLTFERAGAETQEEAAKAIEKVGGRASIDDKLPGKPVVYVSLEGKKIDDTVMKHLEAFPELRTLEVQECPITDEGVRSVRGLKRLQTVRFRFIHGITDKGAESLKDLTNVEWLELDSTKVTDEGLQYLSGMTKLRQLDLRNTPVAGKGFVHLKDLTALEEIDLTRTSVAGPGLENLKGLPKLRRVGLTNTPMNDDGLKHLAELTQVKGVSLAGTRSQTTGFCS
jgi:internalin A